MRTCAIVQARMGSKRLPGKIMLDLCGRPIISWVVNRVKAVNFLKEGLINEIVVATSSKRADDPIVKWCKEDGVECFRGSELDVLDRYYQCAKKYKADWIVRITGDCPLINPVMIAGFLMKHSRPDYDALPFNRGGIPDGWDCEVFTYDRLERAHKESKYREHISEALRGDYQDTLDCNINNMNFSTIKLSVDTPEDLERIKKYATYL